MLAVMELGQKLKEAREAKGFSIDQLQEITKIQKRYLVSIENGDYSILPGSFYTRAFIKQYATAVGLNGEEILEEYKHELPQPVSHDVPQVSTGQKTQETMKKAADLPLADHMPKILIGLGIVAIGFVIWMVSQLVTGKEDANVKTSQQTQIEVDKAEDSPLDKKEEQQAEENKKENVEQAEANKEENKEENVPEQQQSTTEEIAAVGTEGKVSTFEVRNNKALQLELTANGTSYVDVTTDSQEVYSGTLEQGQTETYDLSTAKEVRLNIGSTPNVEIKINGQVVPYPLEPEKEFHQRLVIKNLGEQPVQ